MMKRMLLVASLALFAGPLVADPVAETAARAREAFVDWAEAHDVAQPGFVILHRGKEVGMPLRADNPVEIASLSKAITAVCAWDLIEEGRWSAQTTSAEVLGFGHEAVTVAALLTHSAGIAPDSTQELTAFWLSSNVARKRIVTEVALNRDRKDVGQFSYNNENYAILGEMIEVATGQPYAQTCATRALHPAGVRDAKPSPLMGGMLPWGGWMMSPRDYARFHFHWFGPQGAFGAGSPADVLLDLGGGADYGLGMFERNVADHRNFWHFGLWCVPEHVNEGAFAVIWQGQWSVVATYDACVDWDAMGALDAVLAKVIYGL